MLRGGDFVPTYGVIADVVHLELAARVIVAGTPQVPDSVVRTAHIRCSLRAAAQLRSVLDQLLAELEAEQPDPSGGAALH